MRRSLLFLVGVLVPAQVLTAAPDTDSSTGSTSPLGRWLSLDGAELYIPPDLPQAKGEVDVLVHFHGHSATVQREFDASDLPGVLMTVNRNGLSAVYAAAFEDPKVFARLLDAALAELRKLDSGSPTLRWHRVRVSSFSAGFGAVREILKDQENFDRIDALCMADSIYAGYIEDGGDRRVNPEHMVQWRRFAEAAADGRKRFILTHTDLVPGTYAGTDETADVLIAAVGTRRSEVTGWRMGSIAVRSRASLNGFEVFGCAGDDGDAHMQHLRNLAQWLRLLNDTPLPSDPTDPIVTAINAFEPLWLPGGAQLREIAIVLHPAELPATDADQRSNNELRFRTAAYLYHLIRQGGGDPVLTRPDQCSLSPVHEVSDPAQLAERCRDSKADLLLVFSDLTEDSSSVPSDTLSKSLIATLADSPEIGRAGPFASADFPCPAIRLQLLSSCSREHSSTSKGAPVHRVRAEEICKALVRWVGENRTPIDERRAHGSGDQAPTPEEGYFPETRKRYQDKIGQMARSIWTEGTLPLDRSVWFASMFQRLSFSDRTIVYFHPEIDVEDDVVVIGGATSVPLLAHTLEAAFHRVGIDTVRSEMRLLPDAKKLGNLLYGVCRAPTALTRREPGNKGLPQSQLLCGEPVFLLDRHEGFLLIQAGDGYWGWVPDEAILRMDAEQFAQTTRARTAVLIEDLQQGELVLPRGASLPITSQTGDTCVLLAPEGRRIEVPSDSVRLTEQNQAHTARALRALDWLSIPYVFGGRSPFGLDCSGFVTNLFEQEGMPIPRDAAGQFLSGRLVATSWYRDEILPGDRLYFINETGKVFHTGIALTATHFIHSSPPSVQISSLRPGDRLYVEEWDRAFLAAKRP